MNESLVRSIRRLEDTLNNCHNKEEALRVFCMRSVNLFHNKKNVVTRINKFSQGVLCEKGIQKKAFFTIPFLVDKDKYFFEVFFDNDRLNETNKEDFEIIEKLTTIISNHFGKVDESGSKKYESCVHFKYKLDINQTQSNIDYDDMLFKNFYDRDILYDLMPFKVKEILLIASLYDAFTIENEGNFTQKILGDFSKLNLTSFPRVTAVSFYYDAFKYLCEKHFDLIIVMVGNDKKTPIKIVQTIKNDFEHIPIFMLLNNNTVASEFINYKFEGLIDNLFIWNGDSRIFFSMIKLLEDRINLENDTKIGHARIILLVEDTPRFYSRYLPELYIKIFEQTRDVMENLSETDELYKVLSVRVRPKILLVSTYENAIKIFEKHKSNFLSLITDVEFFRNGIKDKNAGIDLAKHIKSQTPDIDIPIIIQSRDLSNKERANSINCSFIYKNSDTLSQDIKRVLKYNMGFGDFVYCDVNGNDIGYRAKNLNDFEHFLNIIPDDSLLYHATRNHFSLWLMARGEIRFADILARLRSDDFKDIAHIRRFLVNTIMRLKYEKTKGKVVEFSEEEINNQSTVVKLSSGALGGKGRGLVFVNKLVYGFGIKNKFPDINIKTPSTFIIGTDTFDEFIEHNDLRKYIFKPNFDYQELKKIFINSWLSDELVVKLRKIVSVIRKPLAVRSSGLFEDSLTQPFAGVFETYIIPNNHTDIEVRLIHLIEAIKLVYASVFSPSTRNYIEAIDYKIEEEKMAIVIQELVGEEFSNYYYPHISGTAQSYNYYPFSYINPQDGLASLALGLGVYVVGGGRTFHFSPKFPKIFNYSLKDLLNNSQIYFYAVDLNKKELNLLEGENAGLKKLDIYDAEKHGTLKHLASVFDEDNNVLHPGIDKNGQRVIDFANILKFDYIPLPKTLETILEIVKEAMGAPVEIEFAIDLKKDKENKASFYLLQIKPLIGNIDDFEVNTEDIDQEKLIFFTNNAMGNGLIDNIEDIIFVPAEKFDKSNTEIMAQEVQQLNKQMVEQGRKYILIAPGRLGTRDKWLGIPVVWSQISNAKVIIETSLPNFPLDASAGSHFFHNVVSMNVGYFSIQHNNPEHILKWDFINNQQVITELKYLKHVRFSTELNVKMDGKKRIAVIELTK
ncbi:MAG: pyruvate, phosphate dikinase [Bacteroidales bacterium]|nr:pyruvate, phosphate dikinase [Bacteroidales bacterium]